MPKKEDLCACCSCGFEWVRGRDGSHSCSEHLQAKLVKLSTALSISSTDMHLPSMRPCASCKALTVLVGFNFGCYEYQERKQKSLDKLNGK